MKRKKSHCIESFFPISLCIALEYTDFLLLFTHKCRLTSGRNETDERDIPIFLFIETKYWLNDRKWGDRTKTTTTKTYFLRFYY